MQNRKLQEFLISSTTLLRDTIKNKKAIIPLNGGVFAFVLAKITKLAIGHNLTCFYIDNGMMRHNEAANKINFFREKLDLEVWHIDAKELFLNNLKDVYDYDKKQEVINETFLEVAKQTIIDINQKIDFALMGTSFDDVNQGLNIAKALDKNVVIFEPLKQLSLQQVIDIGNLLSIEPEFLNEKIFPLSGFGLMVEDEVREEKILVLKKAYYLICKILGEKAEDTFEIKIRDDISIKDRFNLYIETKELLSEVNIKKIKDQITGLLPNVNKIFIKI
ncbi:GMP synthase [Mycoplasma sp. E35C]|uniref:GMP synthase n=1 Tax=Mycoplasma sp. E35C TaxID=2801918 RepID=UPI001CA40DC8|nr:GMP synthase [Mycoplasma sp. E35C]QZX49162.1 GMP synthase [Mycoplasma sp. E35C]